MNTLKQMMLMLAVITVAVPVFANEGKKMGKHKRNIEQRVENQQKRIDKKVENGKMTAEQAKVEKDKVQAVATEKAELVKENSGKPLSKEQRKTLHSKLNETGKEIKEAGKPVEVPAVKN